MHIYIYIFLSLSLYIYIYQHTWPNYHHAVSGSGNMYVRSNHSIGSRIYFLYTRYLLSCLGSCLNIIMIWSLPLVVRTRKEHLDFSCLNSSFVYQADLLREVAIIHPTHCNLYIQRWYKHIYTPQVYMEPKNNSFQKESPIPGVDVITLKKVDHQIFSASSFWLFPKKKSPQPRTQENQETFDRCWFLKPSQALTKNPQRLESPTLLDECAIKAPTISHSSLDPWKKMWWTEPESYLLLI